MAPEKLNHHFLVVTYPAQGHINPARHLATRLAAATGAAVTLSTAISAHRRMFALQNPSQEFSDGVLTYIPFSDGYDDGYKSASHDAKNYFSAIKLNGYNSLSAIVKALAEGGRPVTCIIYTIMLTWASDVARDHNIPSVLYWIQPATVFSIYYHVFHGYESYVASHGKEPYFTVELPALPPLQIRDLPSFVTATTNDGIDASVREAFREMFEALDREALAAGRAKPRVLFNTFDPLEAIAFASVKEIDAVAVGPVLPFLFSESQKTLGADLFKNDEKSYIEWLDKKEEGSVVYVSFGSMSVLKKQQIDEILKGLKESKKPYLWVVRKDNRDEATVLNEDSEDGIIVEWCSQVMVLSHPAVGCFVSHCGWNSTLESVVCGVPMVCVPKWTDQGTNAKLVEGFWGTGVRGVVDDEGILEGKELKRCLDVVMGDDDMGVEMRRRAKEWREKALEAVKEGGSSTVNLKAFVEDIAY